MSNLKLRILLIFTVVPALFALIFLVPFYNHAFTHFFSFLLMMAGSLEMWKIITGKGEHRANTPVVYIPAVISLITYLECASLIPQNTIFAAMGVMIFLIFARQAFIRDESRFDDINKKITALLLLIFYPGFFFSYTVRLTSLPDPSWTLVGFLVLIFMNDIFAYVFGMWLGKNNRNIFPISPKKSLAGFIGGFFMTIVGAVIIFYMGAPMFGDNVVTAIILASVIGLVAPVGDLIESAMKRSAHVKDSANYIPGRGGVMDNIDSLIFTAPIYYYIIKYISTLAG